MKNSFYILITIILLGSCGPKRMGCGARGICKASQNSKSVSIKKNPAVYFNTNKKIFP
jgi:hypothetical protein